MSAMYYAMTKASFEEVALKFVQLDDSHALKTFLLKVAFLKYPYYLVKCSDLN